LPKKLKPRDWQMTNVIMDFKDQKVLLCIVAGLSATKDWDTIGQLFTTNHYAATIERLFEENGHALPAAQNTDEKIQKS
jgi:hypothetical protein